MKHQYLLDTHALLWMQNDDKRLSSKVVKILTDSNSDLYISIATLWEITIKQSLGKLNSSFTLDEIVQSCVINNIFVLPIQINFLNALGRLPIIHRDPFDRIIAATALEMSYKLISCDRNLHKYDLEIIW